MSKKDKDTKELEATYEMGEWHIEQTDYNQVPKHELMQEAGHIAYIYLYNDNDDYDYYVVPDVDGDFTDVFDKAGNHVDAEQKKIILEKFAKEIEKATIDIVNDIAKSFNDYFKENGIKLEAWVAHKNCYDANHNCLLYPFDSGLHIVACDADE